MSQTTNWIWDNNGIFYSTSTRVKRLNYGRRYKRMWSAKIKRVLTGWSKRKTRLFQQKLYYLSLRYASRESMHLPSWKSCPLCFPFSLIIWPVYHNKDTSSCLRFSYSFFPSCPVILPLTPLSFYLLCEPSLYPWVPHPWVVFLSQTPLFSSLPSLCNLLTSLLKAASIAWKSLRGLRENKPQIKLLRL